MEYQILLKIPLNAMDDLAARQSLRDIKEKNPELFENADIKLQEVFQNKPPRGIHI